MIDRYFTKHKLLTKGDRVRINETGNHGMPAGEATIEGVENSYWITIRMDDGSGGSCRESDVTKIGEPE